MLALPLRWSQVNTIPHSLHIHLSASEHRYFFKGAWHTTSVTHEKEYHGVIEAFMSQF